MTAKVSESLDLCLERALINDKHYSAGVTYRILFTKIFGLPYACAYDITKVKGIDLEAIAKHLNLHKIEALYYKVDETLIKSGIKNITAGICIYGIYPNFLYLPRSQWHSSVELLAFKEGMQALKKILL